MAQTKQEVQQNEFKKEIKTSCHIDGKGLTNRGRKYHKPDEQSAVGPYKYNMQRTDGGGGEKESSVPEFCSLESVCGQACVYRHIARCVFTTIFINHKYSCSGVFDFILPSQAPYEDIQEEDCLMSPAGTKRTSQSSYVVAVSSSMCHALLDVPACCAGYRQPCIDQAPGAN